MRLSVSSRMRAISAFDQSRMPATSSSDRLRRVGAAFGRALADLLGDLLGVGSICAAPGRGRRGGRADRSRQVRHQLGRLPGRRGRGGGGFDLDHALGLLGNLGLGRSGIGRSGVWRGFLGRALPVGGDAQAGVDVGVGPLEVVGRGLGDASGAASAPSGAASSCERSELHGSRNPLLVSLEAMSRDFLYGVGTQPQVLRRQ